MLSLRKSIAARLIIPLGDALAKRAGTWQVAARGRIKFQCEVSPFVIVKPYVFKPAPLYVCHIRRLVAVQTVPVCRCHWRVKPSPVFADGRSGYYVRVARPVPSVTPRTLWWRWPGCCPVARRCRIRMHGTTHRSGIHRWSWSLFHSLFHIPA